MMRNPLLEQGTRQGLMPVLLGLFGLMACIAAIGGENFSANPVINIVSSDDATEFKREGAERVIRAYQDLGYTAIIHEKPSARAERDMLAKKMDAELARIEGYDIGGVKLVRVPFPLAEDKAVLFEQNSATAVPVIDSLQGVPVAYPEDIQLAERFASAYKADRIYTTRNFPQAFKMLDAGRVRYVIAPYFFASQYLQKIGDNRLRKAPHSPEMAFRFYHFLQPEWGHLAEPLARALEQRFTENPIQSP